MGDWYVFGHEISARQALSSLDTMESGSSGAMGIGGSLTLLDSTVTGNAALGPTSLAGGVFHGGDTLIASSTIVNNSAAAGANLRSLRNDPDLGEGRVFGSVIANPLGGGSNCGPDPSAASVSQGHDFSDDDSCNLDATGDRQSAGDAELGALADNGGPTPTMLPADTSPLLDAIPDAASRNRHRQRHHRRPTRRHPTPRHRLRHRRRRSRGGVHRTGRTPHPRRLLGHTRVTTIHGLSAISVAVSAACAAPATHGCDRCAARDETETDPQQAEV